MLEKYKEYLDNDEGVLNTKGLKFRFAFLIIPVIIDLILTIIDFILTNDYNLTYYILRFVTQLFCFLLCLSFAYYLSYKNADGIDGIPHGIAVNCSTCYTLLSEIACLIFFIIYFKDKFVSKNSIFFSLDTNSFYNSLWLYK